MAAGGGGKNPTGKSTSTTNTNKNKKHHNQNDNGHHHHHHRLQNLTEIISLAASATTAVHSFHSRNDLRLLPSQSLSLESSLSSTSLSLSRLLSLLHSPSQSPLPHSPPPPLWFHRFLSSPSPYWTESFRMSKPSFTLLLRILTPSLTSLSPIPPNYALAAALFRLAHGASYKSVARRFGLDSAAACRAFFVVCKAINDNLGHLFELRSDINRIIVGFNWISLPNCCGVLGFHRFRVSGTDLLGENGALLVQALVDSEGRFLDVSAGWPSTMNPDTIFRQSELFSGVEETGDLLNGPSFELDNGDSIPQYILGDSCFPLLPWILTPFSDKTSLKSYEQAFNSAHNRGMELVDTAFGRIRTQWQLLSNEWKEECIEYFPFVVVTCCLLHNFLIKCSEPSPDINVGFSRDNDELPVLEGEVDERAWRIRNSLASYISRVSQWR